MTIEKHIWRKMKSKEKLYVFEEQEEVLIFFFIFLKKMGSGGK